MARLETDVEKVIPNTFCLEKLIKIAFVLSVALG